MANFDPNEARSRYLMGERLGCPPKLLGKLLPVYTIMTSCWKPLPDNRVDPQTLMRDTNQLLFKVLNDHISSFVIVTRLLPFQVFNARHTHTYLTIEDEVKESLETLQLEDTSTHTESSSSSGDTLVTTTHSVSNKGDSPASPHGSVTKRGVTLNIHDIQATHHQLVPMFTDSNGRHPETGFDSPLNCSSRPASSLSGSLFFANMSQFTSLTSLNSSLYSMNSVYSLNDGSQLEYDEKAPLGEGNYGVVFRGVLTRSNGQWEAVCRSQH
jgi:hypothetical protein